MKVRSGNEPPNQNKAMLNISYPVLKSKKNSNNATMNEITIIGEEDSYKTSPREE